VLVAARGTLLQGVPVEAPELLEPPGQETCSPGAFGSLRFMELPYFNSLGGFTPDGREYAIYLGPNTHTPAPWANVIANPPSNIDQPKRGLALPGMQQPAQSLDAMVERPRHGSTV